MVGFLRTEPVNLKVRSLALPLCCLDGETEALRVSGPPCTYSGVGCNCVTDAAPSTTIALAPCWQIQGGLIPFTNASVSDNTFGSDFSNGPASRSALL